MFESYSSGRALHPMWFVHLVFAAYIASMIPRRKKGTVFAVVLYCVLISANMLRIEYIADSANEAVLAAMFRTIVTCTPLLLAAVATLIGREYYVLAAPASERSASTGA
jgi:small-conductance mechanosensitive channel